MPRCVDLRCNTCGREEENVILTVDAMVECVDCHAQMEQVWWKRPRGPAQWDDRTAVMVHVNPRTGEVRYPGTHEAKLKDGYERQYLRSLHEVERFEREHGVLNHTMHYDNNGRAIDDYIRGEKAVH